MKLSEELAWRGFTNQTTYKDIAALDGQPITFYWGVDPSADSMTVGNLAAAMMVRCFIKHGHKAVLLVGGATGLIGDPDGKSDERGLKPPDEIARNKQAIAGQYSRIFQGQKFDLVDNLDWFKDMSYLDFLRDTGKHVPLRQMLRRDFVDSRLGESGNGLSYAEFSYVLIQAYDFLHLYKEHNVTLQVCGSDQWGNSIAGVDLIRRETGGEANVFSAPLVINKVTGQKFGKTEDGAVWLDPAKTSPTQFYQYWINADDEGVEGYLKIFTDLDKPQINEIISKHRDDPGQRLAQTRLAQEATKLVHGEHETQRAEQVTSVLTGKISIGAVEKDILSEIRKQLPHIAAKPGDKIAGVLAKTGLAASNTEARRLLGDNAVSINGQKVTREDFKAADFQPNGLMLVRKGKRFKDSALVELG